MGSLESLARVARLTLLVGLAFSSSISCRKAAPDGAGNRSASPASAPASAAPAGSAPGSHEAQPLTSTIEDKLYAGKCPSWVRGARTKLEDTKDGIRATITADADADATEIRSRARYMAEGKSQGGDATGRCPVARGAGIEIKEIAHGAELTVRPAAGTTVQGLRNRARAMLAKIPNQ